MNDAAIGSGAIHSCPGGVGRCHEAIDGGFLATGGEAGVVVSLGRNVETGLFRSSQLDHMLDLVLVLNRQKVERKRKKSLVCIRKPNSLHQLLVQDV